MPDSLAISGGIILIALVLVSVVAHEVAHGFVAFRLGDPTAKLAGRLTLNPLKHLDIIGSFILPLVLFLSNAPVLFGYAKPVPVNMARLRRIDRDMIWVASAGVAANMLLATGFGVIHRLLVHCRSLMHGVLWVSPLTDAAVLIAGYGVWINCMLAVVNLIPIPPLDGSKILLPLLPRVLRRPYASIERYGIAIIFLLLIIVPLSRFTALFVAPLAAFLKGSPG